MLGHAGDRVRNLDSGTPETCALEQDDLSASCERVGDGRIPIVECSGEVLHTQEGTSGTRPEAPISIGFIIGLLKLSRGCRVAGILLGRHDSVLPKKRAPVLLAMVPKDRGECEVANNRAFPLGEESKSRELLPVPSHTRDARLLAANALLLYVMARICRVRRSADVNTALSSSIRRAGCSAALT